MDSNSIDLILNSVGGAYLNKNIELLKKGGRLVYINAMTGRFPALNIFKIIQKRLHITGSTLRARSYQHKKELVIDMLNRAYPLIKSKNFKQMVPQHFFPIEKAVEAHQLIESRDFVGKIIFCF